MVILEGNCLSEPLSSYKEMRGDSGCQHAQFEYKSHIGAIA